MDQARARSRRSKGGVTPRAAQRCIFAPLAAPSPPRARLRRALEYEVILSLQRGGGPLSARWCAVAQVFARRAMLSRPALLAGTNTPAAAQARASQPETSLQNASEFKPGGSIKLAAADHVCKGALAAPHAGRRVVAAEAVNVQA